MRTPICWVEIKPFSISERFSGDPIHDIRQSEDYSSLGHKVPFGYMSVAVRYYVCRGALAFGPGSYSGISIRSRGFGYERKYSWQYR